MPTKFEQERDAQRLARHQRVAQQIKETDQQMSRETSRTLLLYTGDIVPDPDQPRRLYDEDKSALQELAASIQAVGILSPIQVRPIPEVSGQYMIIVGERRWRACQIAGVNRIEAVVREDWDLFQIRAAQYEENEKRQDVSDIARARSLMAMRQVDGSKRRGWEEVAERVGLQRNQAMRLVGLLQLPESVIQFVDRRLLPGTHASELVRLLKRVPDEEILALAQSCSAHTPGGKARCPVKELTRTITERLQAAHEAVRSEAVEIKEDALGLEDKGASAGATLEASLTYPSYHSSSQSESLPSDGLTQVSPGDPQTAMRVAGQQPSLRTTPVSLDAMQPRPFVSEVIEAWEAGTLTQPEQHLLRKAWEAYPLDSRGYVDNGLYEKTSPHETE